MLRAKQISQISQCARSFYLSGPIYGTADGAPISSSEDEKHASRSQSRSSDVLLKQQKSHVFSSPVTSTGNTGSSSIRNAFGSTIQLASKASSFPSAASQVFTPISSLGSDVNAVNEKVKLSRNVVAVSNNDLPLPSKARDDHVDEAGPAGNPITSKMVSCNAPVAVKQALPNTKGCKSDSKLPTTPLESFYEKPRGRAKYTKVQANSSTNTECGPSSVSAVHTDPATVPEKSSTMRAKQNSHSTAMKMKKSQSKFPNSNFVAESERFYPDGLFSVAKSAGRFSEENVAVVAPNNHEYAHKFSQPSKSSRFQPVVLPSAKHPINSLHTTEHYYRVLQQQKWGPMAEVCLNNLEHKLDAFQANQVLKLLSDHSVALGFFKWLKRQPGFKHDEYTYTTMIGILGKARQFNAMRELLREMIRDGCLPTVVTYNRMIHAYGRANFIGEAVRVFHEMQELGFEPDLVTYCTLIDIHAKAGFLDVALNLYQRMQAVGLSPDTFTYSVMVNCLGKGGQLAAAQKMYLEMIENGCVPNLVTYNIMIALQAKARNYPSAVKLYRDMQVAGFRPDQVTYNIVMEALGHCGHIEEAEVVFNEMRKDCVPDEPVYCLMVDLWGKAGDIERACAWYFAMIEEGLKPNVPTCNSLLSAYLRAHRFTEARGVLLDMLCIGLVPSLQTYTLLLSCCTESNSEMALCGELMAITGHPAHSFLSSLPNAEPSGQNVRNHTSHFFDLMHSEDRESKRGLVDAVVDFLHKSGLKEEAGFVWEVAAQRNVYPESLREKSKSHWLINLHVMSEGTAVTALSRTLAWFQRRILEAGVKPWRIDIITGWGRRSRVTGSSLVRQAVEELLYLFQFPFSANSNNGCFVGCGEPLNQWLLNSYVERMHLL
ncbi:hypothetical protein IEQ34_016755 [Dendrobium chrysotoxum]|uniref:Smr domain-containing protein n=1 Tax=Dendrobium chrysotoxum TaxID=161865 RepID=A0AAV7GEC2_DENCH|nr:hypothetical protein IEQ34_016755 [Dendrobium chrysotoxum]